MATLHIDGTTLAYVERGRGDPVVFVHGSASDYRTWQSQLEEFGQGYRAIAYSRRYHWPNEPIPEGADYAMDQQVEDLRAVLNALGGGPVHLVGHSYGAFVGLLAAIREPRLVRTLVLTEPPVITLFVHPRPRPSEMLMLLLRRPRTAVSIMTFGAKGIRPATAAARRGDMVEAMRVFGIAVLGREFYRRLSPERLEQVRANAIAAEFLGSGFAALDAGAVRQLRTATLLVGGRHSPRVFARLLDRLQELLPHAQRVEIPGASHIAHEDNPPAFNAAVASFLATHRAT